MIPIGSRTATLIEGVSLPIELPALQRYPHIDRGAYSWTDVTDLARLAPLVAHIDPADPRRELVCARLVVLGPGDYILAHHDPMPEAGELPLELVLDLSSAPTPGADLYYRRRGAAYFSVPAIPNTLAIVERGPTVTANHTYVSKRYPSARVVRLIARTADRGQSLLPPRTISVRGGSSD